MLPVTTKRPNACLVASCKGVGAEITKGLCQKCYAEAKKAVASGKTSWERLAQLGMIKSENANSPFWKALMEAENAAGD